MKLHRAEITHRASLGDRLLLRYHHSGEAPQPGQFVMARPAVSGGFSLPTSLFVHDHTGGEITLILKVNQKEAFDGDEILVSYTSGKGFSEVRQEKVALVGDADGVPALGLLMRRLWEAGVGCETFVDGVSGEYEEYLSGFFGGIKPYDEFEAAGYSAVYGAGRPGFLRGVKERCGGVRCELAVGERMACRDGSCFGCAVPVRREGWESYARACMEGPVFGARKLAW